MTKTPEEIDRLELLAASYACDYRDSPNKTNGIPDSYLIYSIAYDAFFAGYQAAQQEYEARKKSEDVLVHNHHGVR